MKTPHPKILRVLLGIIVPVIAFGGLANTVFTEPRVTTIDFRNDMRKLWEDHITWTRLFIVSDIAQLPDEAATTQRLLQNQTDIGNAIKPFYGDAAGDQLTDLLRVHILTAAELLAAVRAGDDDRVQAALAAWYANADDIAAFLHNANPGSWPLHDMQHMMREHLDLTLNEALDHFNGNYTEDVADYDRVHEHILGFADDLSAGIIRQFPQRFAPGQQH
jgi:hypothetical protein